MPVPYTELGKKPRDFFPFRDYACVLDVRKAGQILAWKPLFDLHTGFRQTLATYSEPWLATRPIDTTVEDEILSSL